MATMIGRAFARTAISVLLAGATIGVGAMPAHAGALEVDPVRVDLSRDRKTASITIKNVEGRPVTIRAYPLAWSQPDGEDRYDDTAGVIVSPPVFTIPAGATQIVRVGLRSAAAAGNSYRLMVEEVPEANPEPGIRVALRLNLPLFAMVEQGKPADLSWSAWRENDGSWTVEAANPGAAFVRVEREDALKLAGVEFERAPGVVLPRSSKRWSIGPKPVVHDDMIFRRIAAAAKHDAQELALVRP